ncbi:MAG: molybdopterin-guanine dinucleotide biosynthesis protein [Myxococcales bacterium]|nr:molybdopterin-guanine dinucleotide biosynthesis protein [Myxococcales bacterium]
MTVAAAILAGGRGRRLGGIDKGLLAVGGEPIALRQLRVLTPLVAERMIVAGHIEPYRDFDARLVVDLHPGAGPLAGLEAALSVCTMEHLVVFACDMPFVDAQLVTALRDAPRAEAVVARLDGKAQPLAARYSRAILPRVQRRLQRDKLRLLDLVAELDPQWIDYPAGTRALYNVNTPEELARAEEMVAGARS